jgi:hypothetical protein
MTIGIRPNTVGPVAELIATLREIHDDQAAAIKKRREQRKANGVPDAELDYARAAASCEQAATLLRAGNSADASKEVRHAVEILAGAPQDPPEFVEPEQAAGIRVRIRYLSEAERVGFADAIDIARNAARSEGDNVSWSAVAAVHKAQAEFVARAVAHVDGLSEWDGDNIKTLSWSCLGPSDKLPVEAAAILQSAGVLSLLSDVAMHAQGLSAKKAVRFGLPPPPI